MKYQREKREKSKMKMMVKVDGSDKTKQSGVN